MTRAHRLLIAIVAAAGAAGLSGCAGPPAYTFHDQDDRAALGATLPRGCAGRLDDAFAPNDQPQQSATVKWEGWPNARPVRVAPAQVGGRSVTVTLAAVAYEGRHPIVYPSGLTRAQTRVLPGERWVGLILTSSDGSARAVTLRGADGYDDEGFDGDDPGEEYRRYSLLAFPHSVWVVSASQQAWRLTRGNALSPAPLPAGTSQTGVVAGCGPNGSDLLIAVAHDDADGDCSKASFGSNEVAVAVQRQEFVVTDGTPQLWRSRRGQDSSLGCGS